MLAEQVGVDPRLRDLAEQLLMAVTNAEAVPEAVLVLMTDAAADTAALALTAARKMVPLLQTAPATQVCLVEQHCWMLLFSSLFALAVTIVGYHHTVCYHHCY